MTIPVWLAIGLMSLPCPSEVQRVSHETVAYRCLLPEIQGPPPRPVVLEIPQPVVKKAQPKKKKQRRKKRRR